MNCKRVEILLPKYIEKSISDKERIAVQYHIKTCTKCEYLYNNLSSSLDLLKVQKDIPEQAFYYTRLKQKMQNQYSEKESLFESIFKRKILQPIAYLASIVIAVFIGIQIGSNSGNQNQYTSVENSDKSYTEIFAESQYLNGFEIETIETEYIENGLSDKDLNE